MDTENQDSPMDTRSGDEAAVNFSSIIEENTSGDDNGDSAVIDLPNDNELQDSFQATSEEDYSKEEIANGDDNDAEESLNIPPGQGSPQYGDSWDTNENQASYPNE
jgi:hypothetical protein